MKFCIIGAGPTGLGAAYRLTELGVTDFRLYERNPFVGGLATSYVDDEGFTWDLAVHVTHSHYPYFDRVLDEALPDGYLHHERRSWVRIHQTYVPYPFQYNIRYLPQDALWECIEGLLNLPSNGSGEPKNFAEWISSGFGNGIADHFMLPYNHKIWTVHPAEMAYQWIGDRVPTIDIQRILKNVILGLDDVSWGPNSTFQFPREGGTGAIWKAVASKLPDSNKRLSHTLIDIDPKTRQLTFANGETETYEFLISAMPIPELIKLCKLDEIAKRAGQLRHSHVYVVGVGVNHPIPEDLKEKTWLYCPGKESIFYRVTPFSTFSPAHVPHPGQQCSFLCEISVPAGETRDTEFLRQAALDGLVKSGMLPYIPDGTHTYIMDAPYGYPIPTPDRDRILADVLPSLEAYNIYSRGRFGGWKYEVSNMDHTFMQGVEVIDLILSDIPEETLPTPAHVNAGKARKR
jgi:protoporphyrinogen oxidase